MECCHIDDLCDLHLDGLFMQLKGVAACRGDRWADEVAARRRSAWIPWPVDSELVRKLAIEWIDDLTRDPRLREKLAGEVVSYAAERWKRYRPAASAAAKPSA